MKSDLKELDNKKYKFVIVSTRIRSGGAVVLHNMYQNLIDLGYDARIFYANMYDYNHGLGFWLKMLLYAIKTVVFKLYFKLTGQFEYNNMFCWGYHENDNQPVRRKILPVVDRNTIVVYPEIYYGNMLHAKKVVRWLLSFTSHEINVKSFGTNDEIFTYREIFNDELINPTGRMCNVEYYDLNFYKQTYFAEREGNCFLIYKGRNRIDLPDSYDGIVVDNLSETEKVKVFNKCKYLICYDTQTGYAILASLCGCIPVIIPEEGKTRRDYRTETDINYGIAFGFDEREIAYAEETRTLLIEELMMRNKKAKDSISAFAEECIRCFE